MDAAVVRHVAGQRLAGASLQGIALVTLQAVAVLEALHRVPLADGIGAAEDAAAPSGRDTTIAEIPLVVGLALADSIVAEGILAAILGGLAFGSQLAAEAIAGVATQALALGLAQLFVVLAGGVDVADIRFLGGSKGVRVWPELSLDFSLQLRRSHR